VERAVVQKPHLGVSALLAGVGTQGIRQRDYLTQGF
jgi:hypothetical protein